MGIGDKVREWRERHNVSQLRLAKAIGVLQPHLSDFEAGKKAIGEASALLLQRVTFGEIKASDCVRLRSRGIVAELDGTATIKSSIPPGIVATELSSVPTNEKTLSNSAA